MKDIQSPRRLLLIALVLGWAVDFFFWDKPLGISVFLLALGLMAALFALGRMEGAPPARRNLWLVALLLFFAAMVFVRANAFLTALNLIAAFVLLTFVAYFYAAGRVERLGLIGQALVPLLVGAKAMVAAAPLVRASVNLEAVRERSRHSLAPVARGMLMAAPILAVFCTFLASADLVFAHYVRQVFSLEILPDMIELFWRGFLIVTAAWFVAGGLVYALSRREPAGADGGLGAIPQAGALGYVEAATVLATVDLLFLVFVWIQFAYLFGGPTNIRVDGFTYADYARRGFFELVAVAVLTLGLILGLHWVTRRETDAQARGFNALSSLMVGLALVMLASAFQRMRLYERTYGFTELRLYVYVFIVWLGVALAWFLFTLWRRTDRFAIGALIAALGFVITLDAINPDAFIAGQNLIRYETTGKLDARYLTTLSDDAVPVLLPALNRLDETDQSILRARLRKRLEQMERDTRWRDWRSFHLSRWQAYQIMSRYFADSTLR